MKSNLSIENYKNLVDKAKISNNKQSQMVIKVDGVLADIYCHEIKINDGYINIDGKKMKPLYKYHFGIIFSNLKEKKIRKMFKKETIEIDNIKYYLAKYEFVVSEAINELKFVSYQLYSEDLKEWSGKNGK